MPHADYGRLLATGRWSIYHARFPLQDGRWYLADARCSVAGRWVSVLLCRK